MCAKKRNIYFRRFFRKDPLVFKNTINYEVIKLAEDCVPTISGTTWQISFVIKKVLTAWDILKLSTKFLSNANTDI